MRAMDPFLAGGAGYQEFNYQQQQAGEEGLTQLGEHKRQHGQQMVEVCSPIVSSTSPPEMKSLGSGRTGQFPTRQHDHNNIGSIITMLIDEQGADLDDILTENRERTGEVTGAGERLELQGEIKEEGGCPGTQLTDYPRSYSSPEYYYPVQEVAQEKDVESRSSLSSTSEGDECEVRYRGYSELHQQAGQLGGPGYLLGRSPAPPQHNTCGMRKDDKYWERRRKNNLAAKKSRDARRVRENQLRLRVLCLENANRVLREQMDRKEADLAQLRERICKYEPGGGPGSDHQAAANI